MSRIFDQISSQQLMNFTENYEPTYTLFQDLFPVQHTTAESIKIQDYDVDYNPTALAVADNTIAPLADFPGVDTRIMDFNTFKLEYQLSDSQIRKLETASTEQEVQDAIKMVFRLTERLTNAHYIAQERFRALELVTGKTDIHENGFTNVQPWDYQIPEDQIDVEIDLSKDDIAKKGVLNNQLIMNRTKKVPGRLYCTREQLLKMAINQTFVKSAWGTTLGEGKIPTIEEIKQRLKDLLGWEVRLIESPNGGRYYYNTSLGEEVDFVPTDKMILVPNTQLGNTVTTTTAEELVLGRQEGLQLSSTNGITVVANYEPRPVRYTLTSVSRFNVVCPFRRAQTQLVFKDTSKGLTELLKG